MGSRYGKKAYVNGLLIALNVLFFLYLEITGSSEDAYFMYTKGAMFAPAVLEDGEYYRLLTAMFMHFGIRHIMNNMLVLFVIGDNLERALGKIRYLFFYLTCGVLANVISLLWEIWFPGSRMVVSAGASGVVGGLLYVVTANRGQLEDLNTRQLVIMIFFSLYLGYTSTGVDNIAHLSGLVIGFVLAIILYHRPARDWWADGGIKR